MTRRPLVSCIMVTRNRAALARRAVRCFAAQTWEAKELVVIDDGEEDYGPVFRPYREHCTIHYHRIAQDPTRRLGELRNLGLERASGDFCAQWDDDEWYHPDRLAAQMGACMTQHLDAVLLRWTLIHLDLPAYLEHPYRAGNRHGTPGTILHRRTDVRYPNLARREDSMFRNELRRRIRVGLMAEPQSHLFIRCYHAGNTWDLAHFTQPLRRPVANWIRYLGARYLSPDPLSHPRFRLTEAERDSTRRFLRESREMGLLPT